MLLWLLSLTTFLSHSARARSVTITTLEETQRSYFSHYLLVFTRCNRKIISGARLFRYLFCEKSHSWIKIEVLWVIQFVINLAVKTACRRVGINIKAFLIFASLVNDWLWKIFLRMISCSRKWTLKSCAHTILAWKKRQWILDLVFKSRLRWHRRLSFYAQVDAHRRSCLTLLA